MYTFSGIITNKEYKDMLFDFVNSNTDDLHEFEFKITQGIILFNGKTCLEYNKLKKIIKVLPSNNILIVGNGKYSFININNNL